MTHLFIQNKYLRIYEAIIDRAKLEGRAKGNGVYFESHHVIPKSMGGSDGKANRVLLTAKEHYVCHVLLTKFCTGRNLYKMKLALDYLSKRHKALELTRYSAAKYERDRFRVRLTGPDHPAYGQKISENERKKRRDRMTGANNPMFGRVVSDEEKRRLSERFKGERNPAYGVGCIMSNGERYAGKNHGMYGKTHSEETRAKISAAVKGTQDGPKNHRYGKTESDEIKEKKRRRMTGRKCLNNGETHRFCTPEEVIILSKEGWVAGRIR